MQHVDTVIKLYTYTRLISSSMYVVVCEYAYRFAHTIIRIIALLSALPHPHDSIPFLLRDICA